ncbi:hypothetical protein COD05_03420 [Bacillus cereus]|nr:hypothetical protein CN431_15745 [Bacillus cereus]RFB42106.1 hypothetical protein DZB83_27245 [Bacillus sp. dmp10]RFB70390.1 hypothetical protein DZB94_23165 [Bacillus sp. AW]PFI54312.1 hypothetical protein COI76_12615 [Bacillus cereus]PFM91028.1 hypothetical protein COJ53_09845 [Bacillus cereus]
MVRADNQCGMNKTPLIKVSLYNTLLSHQQLLYKVYVGYTYTGGQQNNLRICKQCRKHLTLHYIEKINSSKKTYYDIASILMKLDYFNGKVKLCRNQLLQIFFIKYCSTRLILYFQF